MLTRSPNLRLSGHGTRLRLHQRGGWEQDPLAALRECNRASTAVDKALGEAIQHARARGVSWQQIGQVLGVRDDAASAEHVIDALAETKRTIWRRFWSDGTS